MTATIEELEERVSDLEDAVDVITDLENMKELMISIVEKHLQAALTEIIALKVKGNKEEGITDAY